MNDKELAEKILSLIGGTDNVTTATHCVTRLRVTINKMDQVKKEQIEGLSGVLGINTVGQQFQVILGSRVEGVYYAFADLIGGSGSQQTSNGDKGSIVSRFLDFLSATFVPVIPAIIGAGLLKGLLILLMFYHLVSTKSSTYQLLSIFSDSAFYFLPILLAFSSAEKFRCNKYVAAAIAGILIHPDLIALMNKGVAPTLFGLPFSVASYASSVLPILLGIWFMSYVERFLMKYIPKMLRTVLVPLLTLLIVTPVLLAILGPIGTIAGNALGQGFVGFYQRFGILAGLVLGAAYPFLVLLGMHTGFTPVQVQSLAKYGVDYVMGIAVASNSAQAGATTAVWLRTKNPEFKEVAGSSALNAIIGITEPALFGVTSKLKKPLIAVSIGGGIGGAIAGAFNVAATGVGTGPIAGIPLFFGKTFIWFIVASIVSFIVAFIATNIIGFEDVPVKSQKPVTESPASAPVGGIINSPIKGEVVPLDKVDDNVFSTGMMGDGIAIEPDEDTIYAPFTGSVEMVFATKHAIGLKSNNGCEVLIHIGLDTVNLKGQYFEALVETETKVNAGDPLIKFDRAKIQAAGYQTTTMIIVTNTKDFQSVTPLASGAVKANDPLLETETKQEGVQA